MLPGASHTSSQPASADLLRPAAAIYVRPSSTFGRKSIEKYCKYISRRKTHVATARRSDYVNNSITPPPPLKKITRRDIEITYIASIFFIYIRGPGVGG